MQWRQPSILAAVLCGAVITVSAGAAEPARRADGGRRQAELAARRAAARTALIETIERRMVRPVDPAVMARDADRILTSLDDARLDALLQSGGTDALLAERSQRVAAAASTDRLQVLTAKALGDAGSDLLFVPVPPCRIIDTRAPNIALGGPIAPSETRSFRVSGDTQFSHQGGNGGGCRVPLGGVEPAAPAVVINFVAVGPAGPGHIEAWAVGQPVPTASVINYSNVPGLNIANGVIVPINGTGGSQYDLNVRANINSTHLVADVTGYFTRFPVDQVTTSSKQFFVSNNGGQVSLADGACKVVNTCTVTSTVAGRVVVRAMAQVSINHTQGVETHDRITIGPTFGSVGNPPSCSPITDQVANMDFELADTAPTTADHDVTLTYGRTFQHPATTRTYSLLGIMVVGASAGDQVDSSRMICWFIPD